MGRQRHKVKKKNAALLRTCKYSREHKTCRQMYNPKHDMNNQRWKLNKRLYSGGESKNVSQRKCYILES